MHLKFQFDDTFFRNSLASSAVLKLAEIFGNNQGKIQKSLKVHFVFYWCTNLNFREKMLATGCVDHEIEQFLMVSKGRNDIEMGSTAQ